MASLVEKDISAGLLHSSKAHSRRGLSEGEATEASAASSTTRSCFVKVCSL